MPTNGSVHTIALVASAGLLDRGDDGCGLLHSHDSGLSPLRDNADGNLRAGRRYRGLSLGGVGAAVQLGVDRILHGRQASMPIHLSRIAQRAMVLRGGIRAGQHMPRRAVTIEWNSGWIWAGVRGGAEQGLRRRDRGRAKIGPGKGVSVSLARPGIGTLGSERFWSRTCARRLRLEKPGLQIWMKSRKPGV